MIPSGAVPVLRTPPVRPRLDKKRKGSFKEGLRTPPLKPPSTKEPWVGRFVNVQEHYYSGCLRYRETTWESARGVGEDVRLSGLPFPDVLPGSLPLSSRRVPRPTPRALRDCWDRTTALRRRPPSSSSDGPCHSRRHGFKGVDNSPRLRIGSSSAVATSLLSRCVPAGPRYGGR